MAIQDKERERFLAALRREFGADTLSLDGLLAHAAALRNDAERYRWLRKNAYIEFPCESPRQAGWTEATTDLSVDAAMASMLAVGAA